MSIRALHYITGDTQKAGFRKIGGSDAFPADQLPYLNNRDTLQERARVESGSGRQGSGGVQVLSHVWEYQTGDFGRPVIINTMVCIGTGRSHGFSEYVLGETKEVADLATPWQIIQAAEKTTKMLDVDTFMSIPGAEMIECPEEVWLPEDEPEAPYYDANIDTEWKMTLLSHYWKQASIRAFSEDSPSTVRVHLGEFGDNQREDIEETIRQAQLFFSDVIVRGLPTQVQNIASMAAGVNGGDINTLYTALEFDISMNMDGENTLLLPRNRFPRRLRLKEAEMEFITNISQGNMPEVINELFERYKKLIDDSHTTINETPFMADYRVLYAVYCLDRIAKEKHAFIEKAGLAEEHDSNKKISDARVCFVMLKSIRNYLEKDHHLNDQHRNLVSELLAPLETAIYQFMLENMNRDDAEPFMVRRNDMLEFHRKTLYVALENQLDLLTKLAVRDQQTAKAPQFVRCYPEIQIRNAEADARNAHVLDALLHNVIDPLINAEKGNEKIDNKYLELMRDEPFLSWAQSDQNAKETKETFNAFLREEIQDAEKHFLLYGITRKYLPKKELLLKTLEHFTQNNTAPGTFPTERQILIAEDGFKEVNRTDTDCIDAMNQYYCACFKNYRGNIKAIRQDNGIDMVKAFGQDPRGAMVLIFQSQDDKPLTPEEAKAVFETFGEGRQRAENDPDVINAYIKMLDERRRKELASGDEETRERLVKWIAGMAEVAPFEVDTSDSIKEIFDSAKNGGRMSRTAVEDVFNRLLSHAVSGDEIVKPAFTAMIREQFESAMADRENGDNGIIEWVGGMINVSRKTVAFDTTDILKKTFEAAKTGERMDPAAAGLAFETMMENADSLNTTVRRAYADMLASRRAEATERKDTAAFDWLCDMEAKAPWKDEEWLVDQHTDNLQFLCGISVQDETEIDKTSISVIRGWLENGTVSARGTEVLEDFCDYWLQHGVTIPVETFNQYFARIEDRNKALQDYLVEQARKQLMESLENKRIPFNQMVRQAAETMERTGNKLDELYDDVVQTKTESFLNDYFNNNPEIAPLIAELKEIPQGNRFYAEWQERLSEHINNQQVSLFNSQPTLEKLINLKEDILKYSKKTDPTLESAYKFIERYENGFAELQAMDEQGAVTNIGRMTGELSRLLEGASDVRRKLCTALVNKHPSREEMQKISFRHALCAEIMQAELTESPRTVSSEGREEKGCPDWNKVLARMFTKQEMEPAIKKPFDPSNLPILQRMLSVTENVRIMKEYGLKNAWAEELVHVIHSDSLFHAYQSALAKNRKMCERYQLEFDSDGLRIDMNTSL